MECKIYVLKDPNTHEIRYVGQTVNPLNARLSAHTTRVRMGRHNIDNKKDKWIGSLLQDGYSPVIEEIDSVSLNEAAEKELLWIAHYKKKGCDLLNFKGLPKKIIERSGRSLGGRKPLPAGENKVTVQFFPRAKMVEALGYERVKEIALEAIEKEYAKFILEK